MCSSDLSIFMMIYGIVAFLVLLVFLAFYIFNIIDAKKTGKMRDHGNPITDFRTSIKNILEKGFPYVLLSPAVLFTIFLTVTPLLFGILIAFTNYSAPHHLPPRSLVDWVGFRNFIDLIEMPFLRGTFLGVALWTFIWAIVATVTTFFGGLIVAVIINRHGIKLKRFWRTIYILPWAMPGFISILIMRNMFNAQFGPINQYLEFIGLSAIPWFAEVGWARVTAIIVTL